MTILRPVDSPDRQLDTAPTGGGAAATSRWYALSILTAIMTVNHIDRTVMSVVVEPVKHEFGVSDAAMGVLTGFAHSAALAVLVLPMGWLADRANRVRLVGIVVLIWSAFTGLGAFARSYAALVAMRVGVGAAEAGGPPASVSLISDLFKARERPVAMGIYYLHPALGTGLIFAVGGLVAHHFGWRAVFLVAGVPGLLLGLLLLLTVREPPRMRPSGEAPASIRTAARGARDSPALLYMLIAGSAATIAQTSVWAWMAAFFMRTHGMNLVDVGILIATAAGVAKGLGSALSGPMIRLLSGDQARTLWRFPALMLVLSVPASWAMVLAPSPLASGACAMLLGAALGCWAGPAMVILVAGVPATVRATSVSLYHLCTNLIGASLGPLFTGLLSDLMGGDRAIGPALALCLTVNLLSAAAFYAACRHLPATLKDPSDLEAPE